MPKRSILVLGATLVTLFSAASGSAMCPVNPAPNCSTATMPAAIIGNYGLEVFVGATNPTYVVDATPTHETVYRFEFYIAHNHLAMLDGTGHSILMARQAGGGGNIIRLFMKRINGNYKLVCRWKRDTGGTGYCGKFTFAPVNTRVGLEWTAATGAGMNDGTIKLKKGNNVKFHRTNLDNDTQWIDTVRWGLPQGCPSTTSGSFYLDAFDSWRTLGPC